MFPIQKLRLLEGPRAQKFGLSGFHVRQPLTLCCFCLSRCKTVLFFFSFYSIQLFYFIIFCLVVHSFLRTLLSPSVHSWSILFGRCSKPPPLLVAGLRMLNRVKKRQSQWNIGTFFFVTKSLPEREVGLSRSRILSKRWIKRSNYLHYLSIYLRYGYTISGTGILSRLESHRASGGGQCSPDPQIPHRRLGSFPIELLGYNQSIMSHVASPSHLSTCWLQRCRCGEVSFE